MILDLFRRNRMDNSAHSLRHHNIRRHSMLRKELDRYLGFGAAVNLVLAAKERTVFVIDVPVQHAEWQSMRLASGLLGGHIYDSVAEAHTAALELRDCLA